MNHLKVTVWHPTLVCILCCLRPSQTKTALPGKQETFVAAVIFVQYPTPDQMFHILVQACLTEKQF